MFNNSGGDGSRRPFSKSGFWIPLPGMKRKAEDVENMYTDSNMNGDEDTIW